ncbi:hypothetical protein H5410_059696 [Solanum commersonii]|uniref:MADS-box domain-containing protein n=1 Tax=Solanum commersonii TaxID=4109 RepID=A0A9J5W380_SOLCO|nr:hypothetical protein H5410_059696 [Solanum commersonii]
MQNKKSKGRQKIPMKNIEKQDNLYASFSKRRMGNPFSFFHPNVDAVVSRFQNLNMELREKLDTIEDIEIAKKQSYDEVIEARHKGWWESIEQLNVDKVSTFEARLETFVFNMQNRLNQLEIGASSSDLGFNV